MRLLYKDEIGLSNFSRNLPDSNNTCYNYDINVCRISILDQIEFENLEKGTYTYVITESSNIIASKVLHISEDGSKHLQIINHASDNCFLTGGEFYIAQSSVFFNVYSGVFECNTDYNIENHENEFMSSIHTIFENSFRRKAFYTADKII